MRTARVDFVRRQNVIGRWSVEVWPRPFRGQGGADSNPVIPTRLDKERPTRGALSPFIPKKHKTIFMIFDLG